MADDPSNLILKQVQETFLGIGQGTLCVQVYEETLPVLGIPVDSIPPDFEEIRTIVEGDQGNSLVVRILKGP